MNATILMERWEQTGLLKGIETPDRKFAMATCLQTQVDINKNEGFSPFWKRVSIPVVRRVLANTRNLFSNRDFDGIAEGANFHFFKAKFDNDLTAQQDGRGNNLQREAEYVAEFSEKILNEINDLFRDEPSREFNFRGFVATKDGDFIMYY